MNNKKTALAPAFPITLNPGEMWDQERGSPDGMTLRDYFAAQALAGLLGNQAIAPSLMNRTPIEGRREISSIVYGFADAMIEARQSEGGDA